MPRMRIGSPGSPANTVSAPPRMAVTRTGRYAFFLHDRRERRWRRRRCRTPWRPAWSLRSQVCRWTPSSRTEAMIDVDPFGKGWVMLDAQTLMPDNRSLVSSSDEEHEVRISDAERHRCSSGPQRQRGKCAVSIG